MRKQLQSSQSYRKTSKSANSFVILENANFHLNLLKSSGKTNGPYYLRKTFFSTQTVYELHIMIYSSLGPIERCQIMKSITRNSNCYVTYVSWNLGIINQSSRSHCIIVTHDSWASMHSQTPSDTVSPRIINKCFKEWTVNIMLIWDISIPVNVTSVGRKLVAWNLMIYKKEISIRILMITVISRDNPNCSWQNHL